MLGKHTAEYLKPEFLGVHNERLQRAYKTGKTVRGEVTTVFDQDVVENIIPLKRHGEASEIMIVAHDITERKRIEKDLKESEERFRELIEKAGIGISIDDVEGNFVYVNQTFADMHGYTTEEILEQPLQSLIHPDDVERVLGYHVARIQGQEAPSRYEYRGVRKDGSVIHLEVDAVSLEEGDTTTGTRIYIWDISDRVRAEEAIKEYSVRLEEMVEERTKELRDAQEQLVRLEKLAILGQMAGVVAHELRNPLAVINNTHYLLETILADSDETIK